MLARLWPFLLLLILGLIWGLQFAMLKLAVESGFAELHVLTLALVLLSVIYAGILVVRRALFSLNRERLIFFTIVATIGYIVPMGATLYAAPYVPAGVLVLIASMAPMFTFAIAIGLCTEHVSKLKIGAMILGTVSATLVLAPEAELPNHGALVWMLLAMLIPFCYGIESVYVAAKWPAGLDVAQVGFGEAFGAAVLMIPLLFIFGEPSSFSITWSLAELAIVVFVLGGVFDVLIYFYLVKTTGGVLVSFGTFIALFAGIGWGVIIFSETHGTNVWWAVAILVVALSLVCLDGARGSRLVNETSPRVG
jgi:drug/metabolite transporter (DMT)-like permease